LSYTPIRLILFYGENAIRENQKDNQRIYISI